MSTTTTKETFYNLRALLCLDNNMLLAGTTSGYQMVNTKTIDKTLGAHAPDNPLVLTSLVVNDNYISPGVPYGGRAIIGSDLPYVDKGALRYNENNLTLEYRPKDKVSDVNNTYSYRLEDGDGRWVQMSDFNVTLSNLAPGDHRLLIMRSMPVPASAGCTGPLPYMSVRHGGAHGGPTRHIRCSPCCRRVGCWCSFISVRRSGCACGI
jgi:hypothetical protein